MRKFLVLAGLLAALAVPATAIAVDLHTPHLGTTCADGGLFHFVANGIDGAGAGALTASFSGGGNVSGLLSIKYNQGTNHWTIEGFGELLSASATKGTKLVLSDYTCYQKKD